MQINGAFFFLFFLTTWLHNFSNTKYIASPFCVCSVFAVVLNDKQIIMVKASVHTVISCWSKCTWDYTGSEASQTQMPDEDMHQNDK